MVLHHINDFEGIINIFNSLLNPGGYLEIADLYPEDGSFNGLDAKVHLGFDPDELTEILKMAEFKNIEYKTCFEVNRESGKNYTVFSLLAKN